MVQGCLLIRGGWGLHLCRGSPAMLAAPHAGYVSLKCWNFIIKEQGGLFFPDLLQGPPIKPERFTYSASLMTSMKNNGRFFIVMIWISDWLFLFLDQRPSVPALDALKVASQNSQWHFEMSKCHIRSWHPQSTYIQPRLAKS